MHYEISSYVVEQNVYHLQTARNSNMQINLTLMNGIFKDVRVLDVFCICYPTAVRQSAEG